MPPKFMFTKEQLIEASLNIIRRGGPQSLTARSLAGELGCSVKPIFGLFKNMEEVRLETIKAADRIYRGYIGAASHAEEKPYKAMGMAYIRPRPCTLLSPKALFSASPIRPDVVWKTMPMTLAACTSDCSASLDSSRPSARKKSPICKWCD